ncbi:S24 family peptidase [Ketogulonicigenium vulgare]|uniref:S24 family peptidase n=1 Tax=Ketogulonicigenium vulgare TaxID=92945 RepID=UPI0023580E26|nr:S24 family peptidase [Ketogulonicigenium vulgare]
MSKKPFATRIVEAMRSQKMSAAELSRVSGVSYNVINKLKQRPESSTNADNGRALAAALGLEWDDEDGTEGAASIAVPGRVGAGDEVFLTDDHAKGDGLYHIECPPQLSPHGVVAVEVQGSSMEPNFFDGDVLFYTRMTADGVPTEAVGKRVVAETSDGRVWVKQLKPGTAPGLFHLLSLNPTGANMHDVQVKWAAPVRLHLPKEFVKKA